MYGASGAAPREARGPVRERPDVLPAPASLEEPAVPAPPRPCKDSVARLTLTGLSYVVTVSILYNYSYRYICAISSNILHVHARVHYSSIPRNKIISKRWNVVSLANLWVGDCVNNVKNKLFKVYYKAI